MITSFNQHSGYYNDGNSHYWDKSIAVDLTSGITTLETTETSYGQAGDYEKYSLSSHLTRALDNSLQAQIRALLKPYTDLRDKYPHRQSFTYFTAKQRYFMTGRLEKAIQLAGDSDFYQIDSYSDVFVLPTVGLIIRIYAGKQDRYSHFKVSITSTVGDNDSDYWF